jgi:hypothetical protein
MATGSDLLYHYTSTQAFVSIIQHKCLWLSGRHNLNDRNEGCVFGTLLRKVADVEQLQDNVERVLKDLESLEAYVCCLSSKGDLLSQWRGYASNATGVSIGFRKSSLVDLVRGDARSLLRPITYADEFSELKGETVKLMQALLRSTGTPGDKFRTTAAQVVWEIKNRAFEEESESRLIVVLPTADSAPAVKLESGAPLSVKHRAADGGVREYCELIFEGMLSAIEEVIIGPRSDSHVDVVRRFLRAMGCKAEVRRSVATYK